MSLIINDKNAVSQISIITVSKNLGNLANKVKLNLSIFDPLPLRSHFGNDR